MLLTISGLGHRFPGTPQLFQHLDLRLEAGHVYGVVGPSGSGKSTLLGILAGWIAPTNGSVELTDKGTTAWVFQNPHGVPRRSALDHVCLPLIAQGQPRHAAAEAARQLLTDLKLAAVSDSPFSALSGGEAQRLMLARALARQPALLLVDEPTAQLDAVTAQEVIDVLGSLRHRSCTVVIATHDPRVAQACDQTIDLGEYR